MQTARSSKKSITRMENEGVAGDSGMKMERLNMMALFGENNYTIRIKTEILIGKNKGLQPSNCNLLIY